MKTIKLFSLAITAVVALASTAWAGPHGGGGGGHFGGGGFGGGHVGGGFRGGGFGGGHFGGARVGGFNGGGIRAAPRGFGGARFSGNRIAGISRPSQRFNYYSGARASAAQPRTSAKQLANRSTSSSASRVAPANRQSSRVNSAVGQKRVMNSRFSTAENRQSFVKNHAFARHDGNWHRDWDKHRAHFDHGRVFVFVGGSWWGLYPWDYYPYYGYYPYDYSYDYPYNYSGYPYDGYGYSSSDPYSYYNGYAPAGQYSNAVVSAVQSKLASLGYYHGGTDGILGDQTQAALARYQQDQDISVTGTVTSATLQSLGLPYSGGL
jgi:hypothetical protein